MAVRMLSTIGLKPQDPAQSNFAKIQKKKDKRNYDRNLFGCKDNDDLVKVEKRRLEWWGSLGVQDGMDI